MKSRKGAYEYGKSKERIQGTDGERGVQLWKKDGTDAEDSGVMVSGTGVQCRGSGAIPSGISFTRG